MSTPLHLRHLGTSDYLPVWHAMQAYTQSRGEQSADEIWLVEHPPVFTQGMNGKPEHLLNPGSVPVVPIDRGGQITYHGPGQLVAYLLLDLRRLGIGVRALVSAMEQAIIDLLAELDIASRARADAPGVYVADAKIAALGLRVRRGCSYHGLALNLDIDLAPFNAINPCGYAGMRVTRLCDLLDPPPSRQFVERRLVQLLCQRLELPAPIEQPASPLPGSERTPESA